MIPRILLLGLGVFFAVMRRSPRPELGRIVTVQFRRDQLHHSASGSLADSPASEAGSHVSLTGRLLQLDAEWVVIGYEHHVGGNVPPMKRETWIPRGAVLYLQVDMDRPPRPQP